MSAVLASSLGAAEPGLKVTVFVYNYAAVAPDVLALTEAEASRIYQQAGIEIQWLDCPLAPKDAGQFPACQVPPGPTRLALRILSQSMAERLRQAEGSFGFALIPEDGSFATVANVFSYDADKLAGRRRMGHGVILGHLAAHELGHLLLGAGSHSSHGIMHVPWRLKELDVIAQGLMVFTPQQTENMRTNIRARAAGERATEEAPAPRTASPVTGLNIEIHVYNYSAASGDLLGRAEQEAFRIFRRTGVATAWLSCPLTSDEAVRNKACALPDAPTRLTLRLLSNSMADSLGVGGDIFGSALLPDNEGFGVVANVYADRTRELADGREFEVILGRVIAHELGHLLLGKNAHSAAGIMHARWRAQDLGLSRQAAMLFLPGEAKRICAQVRARMADTARQPI